METVRRPYLFDVLHVLSDDIRYEIYSNTFGNIKDLNTMKYSLVNGIEMGENNTIIIYTD